MMFLQNSPAPSFRLRLSTILVLTCLVSTSLLGCLEEVDDRPDQTPRPDLHDVDTADTGPTDANTDIANNDTADTDPEFPHVCAQACSSNQFCFEDSCHTPPILAAGNDHTCALLPDTTIKCWGKNSDGQLGLGSITPERNFPLPQTVTFVPEEADTNLPASLFANHNQTCLVTQPYDEVHCWGIHHAHDVINNRPITPEPTLLLAIYHAASSPIQLSLGTDHSCALFDTGIVQCWGTVSEGVLGINPADTTVHAYKDPVIIQELPHVEQIAGGNDFTCALSTDSEVFCWGSNRHGVIGLEPPTDSRQSAIFKPVKVAGLDPVREIAAGNLHACAILKDDTIRCWGHNVFGPLATGNFASTYLPQKPPTAPDNIKQLAMGMGSTCALTFSGHVFCAGANEVGQAGSGSNKPDRITKFVQVKNLKNVHSIISGASHVCAIHDDNKISCWGQNSFGQLGLPEPLNAFELLPVQIPPLTNHND